MAVSIAGHLKLGKLIVLYDSNDITLDGSKEQSFNEDIKQKFEAMGWHYEYVADGNDIELVDKAINKAKNVLDKPSIIEIKTIIGFGAENQGTHQVHGAPLGVDGGTKAKQTYNWSYNDFEVPGEVYKHFENTIIKRGTTEYQKWEEKIKLYQEKYPEEYQEFSKFITDKIDIDLTKYYRHTQLVIQMPQKL